MTPEQMKIGRTIVLASWILGFLCYFPPLAGVPGLGAFGRALFGILFFAHLVEYFFFRKVYVAAGGSQGTHFLRHMVYGILYKAEVEQGQAPNA